MGLKLLFNYFSLTKMLVAIECMPFSAIACSTFCYNSVYIDLDLGLQTCYTCYTTTDMHAKQNEYTVGKRP